MRHLLLALPLPLALLLAACGGGGGSSASGADPLPGIYVNAATGSDTAGDGSSGRPFRSIKRGLQGAGMGDVVRVAAGTYDVANGEHFPIIPGFGVTIQGTELRTAGPTVRLTQIVGGGTWSGDPAGRLHATILPNDGCRLVGLGISNPTAAVAGGTNPCAVLLVFSGATLESCAMYGSYRGVRMDGGVTGSTLTQCVMTGNAIGLFVNDAGAGNSVSACLVSSNTTGVMCFTGGVDFGGGPLGSAGHNAFVSSTTNDFVHFTGGTEVIPAAGCFWDHSTPSVAVGNPAPVPNTDVWIVGGGGVTTTGAQLYVPSNPAAPPGGGAVANP